MKRNPYFLLLLLWALAVLPACAGPVTYSAESIEAWVVDAETKQPIEGAVVVAHWVLEGPTLVDIKVRQAGDLVVLEAVTDKDGRFHFPGWGPIRHWGRSRLTYKDPELIIFKSGYEYRRLINEMTADAIGGKAFPVRRSQWDGKKIELKPFQGTLVAYEEHFESLSDALGHIVADNPRECKWKKIPNTIRAINQERKRLTALGVNPSTLSTIDNRLLRNDEFFTKQGGCGSPKEYFGGFEQ